MEPESEQPSDRPNPKKRKRVTRKQRKLVRVAIKNPEATLRMIGEKAGYTKPQHVYRELQKSHVQDYMRELMARHPETAPEGLHRKLVDGLNAKETKFFQHEGVVTDERDVIDYATRHRYLETAGDWAGLSEKRLRVTQDPEPAMTLLQALDILSRAQCLPPNLPPPTK